MYNPYVIVPLLVWAVTQFLKFIVAAAQGRTDFRYLYASGGMPSVHSAVVTSLAFTAFLIDGPRSAIFGITAILAAIVMYDSFGVRRASGEQAAAINLILDSLNQDKIRLAQPQQRLREILGHKPLEVTIGAAIGFVLAGLLNADRLGGVVDFVTTEITQPVILLIAVVSALCVAAAVIVRFVIGPKYKKITVVKQAIVRAFWTLITLGLLGGGLAFLAYEDIAGARWLLWPGVLLLIALIALGLFARLYPARISAALEAQKSEIEKQKWFEGPNKKKRAAKARNNKKRK